MGQSRLPGWSRPAPHAAKEYGQRYIEATRDVDTRQKEVARLVERSGLNEQTLAALQLVAQANPNPKFSEAKPEAGKRDRTLTPAEETRYFAKAKELAPAWFYRVARLANLTALDLGSIFRLTEGMVNVEAGEIQVTRQKTGEVHNAPLLLEAKAIIAEQLKEQQQRKLRLL